MTIDKICFPMKIKVNETSDNFPLPFSHLSHQPKIGSVKGSGTL